MTTTNVSSKSKVVLATAVLVFLTGLLGMRLMAKSTDPASILKPAPAAVPKPIPLDMVSFEIPCWSCPSAVNWAVSFRTDLDLLAPLGDGSDNAGEWYKDFAKPDGPRYQEAIAMMERTVDRGGVYGKILPGDDPLLLEAEGWCDQAKMHFYPAFFELKGFETKLPNLLLPLRLGRSWVARGVDAEDTEQGLEDCRRTVRLGRLLRQEDMIIITDLIGLACIHSGARGMYEIAQRTGDLELALIASAVIGEVAPQRLMTSERMSNRFDLTPFLRRLESGEFELNLPDQWLNEAFEGSDNIGGRRFLGEVITMANLVIDLGTCKQKSQSTKFLKDLVSYDDPNLSDLAQWALDNPPSEDDIAWKWSISEK